ncbi:MAG: hypothetical protein K2L60_09950 [Bacteroides sp.]|nr:hypothetical protein [Bacteroides sp.]
MRLDETVVRSLDFSLTDESLNRYVLGHSVYGISVDERKCVILATGDEPIVEYQMQ